MPKEPINRAARRRKSREVEAARAAEAPRDPSVLPNAHRFTDCEFVDCGTGIDLEGGALVGDKLQFRNTQTAIRTKGTDLDLTDVDIE